MKLTLFPHAAGDEHGMLVQLRQVVGDERPSSRLRRHGRATDGSGFPQLTAGVIELLPLGEVVEADDDPPVLPVARPADAVGSVDVGRRDGDSGHLRKVCDDLVRRLVRRLRYPAYVQAETARVLLQVVQLLVGASELVLEIGDLGVTARFVGRS